MTDRLARANLSNNMKAKLLTTPKNAIQLFRNGSESRLVEDRMQVCQTNATFSIKRHQTICLNLQRPLINDPIKSVSLRKHYATCMVLALQIQSKSNPLFHFRHLNVFVSRSFRKTIFQAHCTASLLNCQSIDSKFQLPKLEENTSQWNMQALVYNWSTVTPIF